MLLNLLDSTLLGSRASTHAGSVYSDSTPHRPLPPTDPVVLRQTDLNQPKLAHHASKLDLIDDTTLTSLPLPPPPPVRLKRGDLAALNLSRRSASSHGEHRSAEPVAAWGVVLDDLPDVADDASVCSYADETFEASEDPIVLVEDYVNDRTAGAQRTLFRKKSLASFKQRLRVPHKRSVPSEWGAEDLEAIFGKIPGADKLKHCSLCDKPLYEISSIISNPDASQPVAMNTLYEEFVCWECINVYEQFLSELYATEVHDAQHGAFAQMDDAAADRLLHMFNAIKHTYEPAPKRQRKRQFSDDLLSRLHSLSTLSDTRANGSEWLALFRSRLRWRWGLERLLPNLFGEKHTLGP